MEEEKAKKFSYNDDKSYLAKCILAHLYFNIFAYPIPQL